MESLTKMLSASAQNPSTVGLLLIFLGGVATSLSPCVLPVLPLVIGYMGGYSGTSRKKTFFRSLFLIAGLTATLVVFGLASSFLGILFGSIGKLWYLIVSLILILMGVHLTSLIKIKIPGVNVKVPRAGSLPGAFLVGLIFGLVTSSCGTPILVGVLSYVSLCKSYPAGAFALFLYGMGRGVVLLLIATVAGLAKSIRKIEPYSEAINKFSGFLLIAVGIYLIYQVL